MFCVKCGAQLDDNAIFCPKCGNKVGEVSATASASPEVIVKSKRECINSHKVLHNQYFSLIIIFLIKPARRVPLAPPFFLRELQWHQ